MSQRGINKAIIVGRLGQDPETRFTPSGSAITNISVATSESWKDKQTGQPQEKIEWHKVSIFGKLAEIAGEYLTKGSQIYIEGKLQTRKYQDKASGQDKYSTEIIVDGFNGVMQMLGSSGGAENSGSSQGSNNAVGGQQSPQPANNFDDFEDSSIPF